MKLIKRFRVILSAGLLMLGVTERAHAAQNFVTHIHYGVGAADEVPEGWFYQITSNDPSYPSGCQQNGTPAPAGNKDIFVISNYGPPLSGSASRTRYLTACYTGPGPDNVPIGSYITIRMTIEYYNCVVYICGTRWMSTILRQTPSDGYFVSDPTIWPDFLDVIVEW